MFDRYVAEDALSQLDPTTQRNVATAMNLLVSTGFIDLCNIGIAKAVTDNVLTSVDSISEGELIQRRRLASGQELLDCFKTLGRPEGARFTPKEPNL